MAQYLKRKSYYHDVSLGRCDTREPGKLGTKKIWISVKRFFVLNDIMGEMRYLMLSGPVCGTFYRELWTCGKLPWRGLMLLLPVVRDKYKISVLSGTWFLSAMLYMSIPSEASCGKVSSKTTWHFVRSKLSFFFLPLGMTLENGRHDLIYGLQNEKRGGSTRAFWK